MLISAGGEKNLVKAAQSAMPWAMKNPRREEPAATPDEVALAEAELEQGIVFT